jgi:hypothetical protein
VLTVSDFPDIQIATRLPILKARDAPADQNSGSRFINEMTKKIAARAKKNDGSVIFDDGSVIFFLHR